MTLAELRHLAEQLPTGVALTIGREALLEALGPAVADLTVTEVADRLHRAPSTVRGWIEAGRLPGAFKFNSRDWRIPLATLDAFVNGQRAPESSRDVAPGATIVSPGDTGVRPRRARKGTRVDLGAWRAVR